MKQYLLNLKNHPGVPVASVLCVCGFFAGIDRGIGMAIFSTVIFWIPVLLTARRSDG